MKTITLTNDFHNTEARVRPDGDGYLNPQQVRRAWKKLCGMDDCLCSGSLGDRPHQATVTQDGWAILHTD